jgi:hypothetical protein
LIADQQNRYELILADQVKGLDISKNEIISFNIDHDNNKELKNVDVDKLSWSEKNLVINSNLNKHQEQIIYNSVDSEENNNSSDNKNINTHRLSTILEATNEDSPLKPYTMNRCKKVNTESNLFNNGNETKQPNSKNSETTCNEFKVIDSLLYINDQESLEKIDEIKSKTFSDFDNIPLGIKSTNKMSFEELIEEKLKISDELDKEHFQFNNLKKTKIIKTKHNFTENKKTNNTDFEVNIKHSSKFIQESSKHEKKEIDQILGRNKSQNSIKIQPRKFLKKGEGLKRFNPKSSLHSNQSNLISQLSESKNQRDSNSIDMNEAGYIIYDKSLERSDNTSNFVKNDSLKLKKKISQTKLINQSKTKTDKNDQVENFKEAIKLNEKINLNCINQSDKNKNSNGIENDEEEELKEFEKLEQYVDEHPSFFNSPDCNRNFNELNSKENQKSSIEFLLNDSINDDSLRTMRDSKNNISKRKVKQLDNHSIIKLTSKKIYDNKFEIQNNFHEINLKYSNIEPNKTKMIQEISNNPNKSNDLDSVLFEKKFDDKNSWLDSFKNSDSNPIDLMDKLFPNINDFSQAELEKNKSPITQPKLSSLENCDLLVNDRILIEKLKLLEFELEKFQKKNIELIKLQEKLENDLKITNVNQKIFEKQMETEKNKLKENFDEEYRKFTTEKKNFEKFKQSFKENPDRKERDEINKLKKQVNIQFFFNFKFLINNLKQNIPR